MFGQRFRLKAATIALGFTDVKKTAFQIPAGAEIVVIDGIRVDPKDLTRTVSVEWESKTVTMFAVDLRERGYRI
jgi:hypothetical protein